MRSSQKIERVGFANATLANTELLENKDGLFSWSAGSEPSWPSKASFLVNITVIATDQEFETVSNSAPYFVPRPTADLTAVLGKAFEHSFGAAYDYEDDPVTVTVDFGTASSFAKFDAFTNTI